MKANAEVIILEDDAKELEELRVHFSKARFHPITLRSASRAISSLEKHLQSNRPIVAIVDWDLSKAPDQASSSSTFLAVLARQAPDCLAIVFSANIDSFRVRSDIQRAHPRAWLHDKREGYGSLLTRVHKMLDRTVEDLRIKEGTLVIHVPTQAEHHHREAVRLVVHYPEIVTFHSDTATKAVWRFGKWLDQHASRLTVVSHGNRKYRLAQRTSSHRLGAEHVETR
ncbi:MAG TPA: hypothetical protein VE219_04405 [Candidatus Sulfotelmatobacter sp.]|nr:hypothetical protein [Candidatus Sulfotelmatobacter sp.]